MIPQSPFVHVQFDLKIESFQISPMARKELSERNKENLREMKSDDFEYFSGQNCTFRDLHIGLRAVEMFDNAEDIVSSEKASVTGPDTYTVENSLVRIMTASLQLWGKKERNKPSTLQSIEKAVMDANIQNIDCSPSVIQIQLMCNLFTYLEFEAMKQKIKFYVQVKKCVRYVYAIKLVIACFRIRKYGKVTASLHYDIFFLSTKSNYKRLYRRIIQCRLTNSTITPPTIGLADGSSSWDTSSSDLTIQERERFDFLCLKLQREDQLELRKEVHKYFLVAGKSISEISVAVRNSEEMRWWPMSAKKLYPESSRGTSLPKVSNSSEKKSDLAIEVTLRFGRLCCSIMDSDQIVHPNLDSLSPSSPYRDNSLELPLECMFSLPDMDIASFRSYLSLTIYGVIFSGLIASESKMIQIMLGTINLFGIDGETVLSCGVDPDDWFSTYEVMQKECTRDRIPAVRLSIEALTLSSNDAPTEESEFPDAPRFHNVIDAHLRQCVMNYSFETFSYVKKVLDFLFPPNSYRPSSLTKLRERITQKAHLKNNPCAKAIIKSSIEVKLEALHLSIPFHDSPPIIEHENGTLRRSFSTSHSTNKLELFIGPITVISGDYTQSLLSSVKEKSTVKGLAAVNVPRRKMNSVSENPKLNKRNTSDRSEQKAPSIESSFEDNSNDFLFDEIGNLSENLSSPIIFKALGMKMYFIEHSNKTSDSSALVTESIFKEPISFVGVISFFNDIGQTAGGVKLTLDISRVDCKVSLKVSHSS